LPIVKAVIRDRVCNCADMGDVVSWSLAENQTDEFVGGCHSPLFGISIVMMKPEKWGHTVMLNELPATRVSPFVGRIIGLVT